MDGYWTLDRYPDHFGPVERDRLKEVLREAPKGKDVVLFEGTSLTWHPKPDSLDAAWAECEASKPDERCGIALIGAQESKTIDDRTVLPYSARLWIDGRVVLSCEADTPVAALHALTTELKGRA